MQPECQTCMTPRDILRILLVSLYLHVYFVQELVWYRVCSWDGVASFGWAFLAAVAAPALVHATARRGTPEAAGKYFMWTSYVWGGTIFLYFGVSFAMDLLSAAPSVFSAAIAEAADGLPGGRAGFSLHAKAATTAALLAYSLAEAKRVVTKRVILETAKLPRGVRFRIAQISDLHLGMLVGRRHARRVVDAVNAARPDVVVSTGDLIDTRPEYIPDREDIEAQFARINAPRYGILGNHEPAAGLPAAIEMTESLGFRLLRGEGVAVRAGIRLVGVDDPAIAREEGRARGSERDAVGIGLKPDYVVLLKHRPLVDRKVRPDLQLSGHTHGGQVIPFRLISKMMFKRVAGRYDLGDQVLYVSPGTGTWGPPMRLLTPPQVTVVDIVGTA